MEDCNGVLCKILESGHEIEDIERILDPEAGSRRSILQRDHNQRSGNQKDDGLEQQEHRESKPDFCPCIDECPDAECELTESFDIEYFRLIIEKQIDRAEAILDKIAGIDIHPQTPVIIKETLHRCQGDEGEPIEKEDLIIIPAVDRREIAEQDPEADKASDIRKDHSDS